MKPKTTRSSVCIGLVLAVYGASVAAAPNEQFIPVISIKTGPAASVGSGIGGGFVDYLDLLNKRDGGINGVKLAWEECETGYQVSRAVECYERLKNKGAAGASSLSPFFTGAAYVLTERSRADKIPLAVMTANRSDASDGRVFPYTFTLVTNWWSANTAKVRYIGSREGGMDKLKGKKIVNLYLGAAFGKETMSLLDIQAEKYGFEVIHIEVPIPGADQQAQWLRIRQLKPDWVIVRLAGVSVSAALKTAQRVGFPADRMVGVLSLIHI